MDRRTTFLAGAVFIIITLFVLTPSAANCQTQVYVADTGVVSLQPGQVLRISADGAAGEIVTVRFKKLDYADVGIAGGVLRKQLVSQAVTNEITLGQNESASVDFQMTLKGIRAEVSSSSKNIKLNAFVISPATSSSGGGMEQISFNFTSTRMEY